jgi:hypothetical protein
VTRSATVHLFLLLALTFIGCGKKKQPVSVGPGSLDFNLPLAGKYQLWRTSSQDVHISPRSYDRTTPMIPTKVVEIAWDNRFILAKREAIERLNQNTFDYWILDTSLPKVFGPFDESTFQFKRADLAVPEKLILKDVYSFRP